MKASAQSGKEINKTKAAVDIKDFIDLRNRDNGEYDI